MNINEAFTSNYLKSQDLHGDTVFTMDKVTIEELGQGTEKEKKAIVYFRETDKGLALNVTNKNTIVGLYGEDTDAWLGQKVTLFATEVDFRGEQVLAIRVRMRKPTNGVAPAPAPQPAPSTGGIDPAVSAARAQAWETFKTLHPGKPDAEIIPAWRAFMAETISGRKPSEFSAADWTRIRLKAVPVADPFAESEDVFKPEEVPF